MEWIEQEGKSFLLRTAATAYLLCINEHGHVEQVHYGAPVALADAAALRYKRTMMYGAQVMYAQDEKTDDQTYCLDNVPLNWSGMGRGDFRTPPFEAQMPDGSFVSDFVFERFELKQGAVAPETLPGAYAADNVADTIAAGVETGEKGGSTQSGNGCAETLVLCLREAVFDLQLQLIYTVYPECNVITRRAVLENREQTPVTLRRMMSMLLDLPGRAYRMSTLDGDWIQETHRHDRTLMPGTFVNQSTTGASSNRHNPGVMLAEQTACEDSGNVYGFNLVYSGNHYTAVELSPRNLVRVVCGINPLCFSWTLAHGERFETPEAVITFSQQGYNGMSRNFHSFVNQHIVRGEWKGKERPVLLNNWEAHFFNFTRRKLLRLARRAKKLGVELFVLDDGWFGARNSDKAGLGDYAVNREKLPDGIAGLARRITGMGLRFGLWFEPESVNPDSDLYRAHPEYAIAPPGRAPLLGRNQLLLDLTNPAVRDYIVREVCAVLDSADISYVKWDMNRHISDMFSACCSAGEFFHRYSMGLYEVLGRIFRPRPHILLESCSSGGNRFDLGMLCYSPQIWASDDTDPIERLRIQKGLSYFYPQSCMGAHVSQTPHQQTLRATPLSTRFNVAAFGALGYELDLGELTHAETQQVKAQIAFYKQHRCTFQYGDFYRCDLQGTNGEPPRKELFTAAERDGGKAVAAFVQTLAKAGDSNDMLQIRGLCPHKRYALATVPQRVCIAPFGGLLKHISPVPLHANGLIMRTVSRLWALADGSFDTFATGAALRSGVALNNQFIGTGYSRNLRLWGDFGSQLYVVSQCEQDEG